MRIPFPPSPGSDPQGAQIVEAFRVARIAANAKGVSKGQFLLIFFGLTGLAIALAYLLKRGP